MPSTQKQRQNEAKPEVQPGSTAAQRSEYDPEITSRVIAPDGDDRILVYGAGSSSDVFSVPLSDLKPPRPEEWSWYD